MKLLKIPIVSAAILFGSIAYAQQPGPEPLTIRQAVARSGQFPAVSASEEQVNAAVAGIRLARTNYLPTVNAMGQMNRATRNNVFGLLLPQAVIPSMSGPVLGTNDGKSVWGSGAGILVSWEPFDFGRRRAQVRAAEATRERTQLSAARTQFDIETETAAAFLTVVASNQTVRAAQAAVDRAKILARSVKALVDARLRPGADLSRTDTELDAAEAQLLQAEQSVEVAKTSLAEFTGLEPKTLAVATGRLLDIVPELEAAAAPQGLAANPSAKEQAGAVEESHSRLAVLQRSFRPTFELQGAAYGRGSGALINDSTLGGWNGLAPNYFNVGVGFTVNFALLNLPSIRAQEAREEAIGRSAAATYRQVLVGLQQQLNAAQATLQQARRIAGVTPKEVLDARAGFAQANAQYKAGLTSIVAVAEAQRLLAQAEIDDSLAKLAVWRAWLQTQIVNGDISPFLKEASR